MIAEVYDHVIFNSKPQKVKSVKLTKVFDIHQRGNSLLFPGFV